MRVRPRLLDLFCGAGGCAVGYHRAGFDVVGADHLPQPHYPFEFVQADALEYVAAHGKDFDAIHASPPCQKYSVMTRKDRVANHPGLVEPTRLAIARTGLPYVIENVMGAPLQEALLLCGSMFGLLVQRHRLFESSTLLLSPGGCRHGEFTGNYPCGRSNGSARAGERSRVVHVYGQGCSRGPRGLWQQAMGIDWMTMREMAQAIPPAYTEFIGRQLMNVLGRDPPCG